MNMTENDYIKKLAHEFRPYELTKILSFQDAMRFTDRLLAIDPLYDPWRHYAIELLYSIREKFPKDWDSSWRHSAYLGKLCASACRYSEKYEAYRRAMTQVSPIPPELLVAFAGCNSMPGIPSVSEDEALQILIKVAHKYPYKDVVRMIVKGCFERFNKYPEEFAHWEDLYKRLEDSKQDKKLPEMYPKFLNEEIKIDLSKIAPPSVKNRDEELFNIANKVFSSEKIPFSIRGIAVGWEGDELVLWVYHENELDADTEALSLMAYIRIASHYLKDYIHNNIKLIEIENSDELPHHKYWVFLREKDKYK